MSISQVWFFTHATRVSVYRTAIVARARKFATPAVYRSSLTENATASSSQSCHTPSGSCDATVSV